MVEPGERITKMTSPGALRKLPAEHAFAHLLPVGQWHHERPHAAVLSINYEPRNDDRDTGHVDASERDRRGHILCCAIVGNVKVEASVGKHRRGRLKMDRI